MYDYVLFSFASLSPRRSRLWLLITWEGRLAPRWVGGGGGCFAEDMLVLAFLQLVVKLIKSEITCYLLNVVLTVFLFVFVFMFKTVLVLKGKL